ncbi:MAG: phenylalanine--tRNA ligase subunit beta [Candidatus Nanohalarchaeota archaeon]|nr:MAG: phenylalanine--tRNA ligase subunit beta [Candidatus Nanohaloarchaeota archaeon]
MVMIDVKHSELCSAVGKNIPVDELSEILFDFGLELKKHIGDDLSIELTAERSDLISLQGLARALRNYTGLEDKMPEWNVKKSNYEVEVTDMPKQWSYVVCAVAKNLKFDDEKIREVMRVQEKLAGTFLRNRKKGGIGIYPLDKIHFPVKVIGKNPDKVKYRPLEYPKEITAKQILSLHPTGKKYAHLVEGWKKMPFFIDSEGTIMSMPPIINSHTVGKITPDTKDIFIEATGINLKVLEEAVNIICAMFEDMGADIYSTKIKYSNRTITTPNLAPYERQVSINYANKMLGLKLSRKDTEKLLKKMMYGISKTEGDTIKVKVPKVRVDLWHQIDLVDDIARAYKFNKFPLTLPSISTIASTLPLSDLSEQLSDMMVGLGFAEIYTLGLTSTVDQYEKMNIEPDEHIHLNESAEQGINMTRTWLLPESLNSLEHNKNRPVPQKIFECSFVVIPDAKEDVRSRTVKKLCACISDNVVTFTQIKQVLDALLCAYNLDLEIQKTKHSSFMNGRCGKIIANKKEIGIIGEINPAVLSKWSIVSPTACFEINIDALLELMEEK